MKKITIRENGSKRVTSYTDKPSRVQGQFKESCDINKIIARYKKTGELPVSKRVGQFLAVDNIPDYETAMQIIVEGNAKFEALPSSIRARFGNSPSALLEFMNDPANRAEAERLGLVEIKPTPTSVPPTQPSVPATENTQNNQNNQKS